jgi:hypothetical protein
MGVKVIKRIMWNKFVQVMLPAIITSNPWATYILFSAPYSEKVSFLNTCYHWFHTLFTGISKKIKRKEKNEAYGFVWRTNSAILLIAYWVYALTESTGQNSVSKIRLYLKPFYMTGVHPKDYLFLGLF